MTAGASAAAAQDLLKLAVPQRGSWDAGLPELGKRSGIFKKHGLDLEILYTQAGPESIQALIGCIFSEFTTLPEKVVSKARELVPKENLLPDRIVGVDQIISEAVSMRFLPAPAHA